MFAGLMSRMDDSLAVRCIQCIGNLRAQPQHQIHFQWPPRDAVLQRYAIQVFHRHDTRPPSSAIS